MYYQNRSPSETELPNEPLVIIPVVYFLNYYFELRPAIRGQYNHGRRSTWYPKFFNIRNFLCYALSSLSYFISYHKKKHQECKKIEMEDGLNTGSRIYESECLMHVLSRHSTQRARKLTFPLSIISSISTPN